MLPTTIFAFGFVQAVIISLWKTPWFWWVEVPFVFAAIATLVVVWLVHQNFGGSPR